MHQATLLTVSLIAGSALPARTENATQVCLETFEQGRQAWEPADVGTVDPAHGHRGASLKIADEDNAAYFTTMQTVPVEPDSRYEVSFWCFTRDAEHASLALLQRKPGGDATTESGGRLVHWCFPFQAGKPLGEWVETKHTLTTGPETSRVSIILNPADGSKEHTGTAWYDDLAVRYVGRAIEPAEKSLPLRTLEPLELDLGAAGCTIVCPDDEGMQAAAKQLASVIEAKTGRTLRVVGDKVDATTLSDGPILVLGNLVVSALGKKLYFEGHDFTDYAWPGKGGYVVRTIRDPFGTGAHVLLMGGSHPEDIAQAAARVGEIVNERGPKLAYLNEVKLGKNAAAIEAWSSEFLAPAADWKRSGSLGSWEFLWQIGKAGMGYLRTGNEAYLPVFKRELLHFFEHDVFNREQEAPSQIHSLIDAVLLPWDLFADHPFFSAEDRRDIDEKFLLLACGHEGARPLKGAGWELRGNHGLGRALDGFWLGRYFWRRYGIEEAQQWMDFADKYFAPQLESSKPTEDGGYHQYQASLLCTLMYALAAGKQDYLTSRALREATDRAILDHRLGKAPMAYLGARAVSANDPGYLALMAYAGGEEYVRQCAAMRYGNLLGENMRSFCGFETPREKPELLGARVAPLDPRWHERRERQTGASPFVVTTTPEESYDKLVIRDGYQTDSFYLKMDGLGAGGHSFQDANCLTAYHERGVRWLFQEYGYSGPTCSTLRQQNGVFVALDGQGPPGILVCARLLYARKLGNDLECVAGALEGLGEVAWHRHLVRKKAAWTLVIDRAIAKRQGELLAERHWHIRPEGKPGEVTVTEGVAVCRHGDAVFHLHSAGLVPEAMTGTSNRKEVIRARVEAEGFVEMASLIWVDGDADSNRYQLEQTNVGWRVRDQEGGATLGFTVGDDGLALSPTAAEAAAVEPAQTLPLVPEAADLTLPWKTVDAGDEVTAVATAVDRVAVGTRNGTVKVVGLDGADRWQSKVTSWVLSLHFLGDDLLVGEDNGTLSRFDASDQKQWSVTTPYAHIGWPHWSDGRSRIRELTSADIDGDGQQEILVSNGDRRLYVFEDSGALRWKKGVQWGVLIGLTPTTYEGRFALFGGVTGPTLAGRVKIHDAEGNTNSLQIAHQHSQQIRDLRLVDLTGDGKREIIVARDTSSNQLVVCNGDRSLRWQADVAGSPDGLAVRSSDGATQVLCASRGGYLHAFEGGTGRQLWFCYLGDEAHMLHARQDGSVLAFCPTGNVFVVSAAGELVGRRKLPAPITALLRPGEHRLAPSCIPVGTRDGTVYLLPAH